MKVKKKNLSKNIKNIRNTGVNSQIELKNFILNVNSDTKNKKIIKY